MSHVRLSREIQYGPLIPEGGAHVIVGLAPALSTRLAPGGTVIAAGLIDTQELLVTESFRAAGLHVVERAQEKDWVSLVARRR